MSCKIGLSVSTNMLVLNIKRHYSTACMSLTRIKLFIEYYQGVNFGVNLINLYCKLGDFKIGSFVNNFPSALNWFSLLVNLLQKSFIGLVPRANVKVPYGHNKISSHDHCTEATLQCFSWR
jgi:hypothetical protein